MRMDIVSVMKGLMLLKAILSIVNYAATNVRIALEIVKIVAPNAMKTPTSSLVNVFAELVTSWMLLITTDAPSVALIV